MLVLEGKKKNNDKRKIDQIELELTTYLILNLSN